MPCTQHVPGLVVTDRFRGVKHTTSKNGTPTASLISITSCPCVPPTITGCTKATGTSNYCRTGPSRSINPTAPTTPTPPQTASKTGWQATSLATPQPDLRTRRLLLGPTLPRRRRVRNNPGAASRNPSREPDGHQTDNPADNRQGRSASPHKGRQVRHFNAPRSSRVEGHSAAARAWSSGH